MVLRKGWILALKQREPSSQDIVQVTKRTTRGTVLFIAPQPFYEDRGTPIAVREVLVALSELGWEVDLLTFPMGQRVDLPGLRTFRVPNPFGFRRVPIGFSGRKILFDLSLCPAIADRLRRRHYDCIHAVEEAAFPATAIAKRHGVPVLYDMQSCLPDSMSKNFVFRIPPMPSILEDCQAWLVRRADAVACSAGLEDYVRSVDSTAKVVAWHYPASHVIVSPEEAAELRRSLGIAEGRPVVLYTGNFEKYQGIPRLVNSIPTTLDGVPDALFLLVGANGSSDDLPPITAELRRQDRLRTLPRQPRESMAGFLALADVVVSPREAVGNLPLKVFDYMAAGSPIVATDSPTHRTVLNENNARLVSPDGDAMGTAIAELLLHPDRAAELGRNARAFAEETLGWVAFKGRVAALYDSVVPPGDRNRNGR